MTGHLWRDGSLFQRILTLLAQLPAPAPIKPEKGTAFNWIRDGGSCYLICLFTLVYAVFSIRLLFDNVTAQLPTDHSRSWNAILVWVLRLSYYQFHVVTSAALGLILVTIMTLRDAVRTLAVDEGWLLTTKLKFVIRFSHLLNQPIGDLVTCDLLGIIVFYAVAFNSIAPLYSGDEGNVLRGITREIYIELPFIFRDLLSLCLSADICNQVINCHGISLISIRFDKRIG